MKKPTLSVVVANYNHAQCLPQALNGIVHQSRLPDEVLILDDGSTDNSVEVIESFARKCPIIRLIKNDRNMGIEYSFRKIMSLASGDYLCGAAADDCLLPGFIERSMRLLTQYPTAGLCTTMSTVVDGANDKAMGCVPVDMVSDQESFISPAETLRWLRTHESWMVGNACIYRRQALLDEGGFPLELRSFCDGFIQMVLALRCGACFIPAPLAMFRQQREGYSSTSQSGLDLSLQMWKQAASLMRTKYPDLFPEDFIDKWEGRRLCRARLYAISRLQKDELEVLKGTWTQERVLDRLFVTTVAAAQSAILAATMFYQWIRGDAAVVTVAAHAAKAAWRRRMTRRVAQKAVAVRPTVEQS